jgi:ribosomal protein L16 Arg81 hydroxylase
MPPHEFLSQFWARKFVHIAGAEDRFRALFSWELLNTALEQYRFEPPRIRVFKAGKQIEPTRYLTSYPVATPNRSCLNSADLTNELRRGATLVLDCVDELSAPLRDLAAGLERIFRVYINANLYAAFHSDKGFPRHWDDHNTFILQVTGRKRWLVYEPLERTPLGRSVSSQRSQRRKPYGMGCSSSRVGDRL